MKAYPVTSVWWLAYVAEVESQMVVVEETLMVEVERYSEKACGLVVYTKAMALRASEVVCGACRNCPMCGRQTGSPGGEGPENEVLVLGHDEEVDVWEFSTG